MDGSESRDRSLLLRVLLCFPLLARSPRFFLHRSVCELLLPLRLVVVLEEFSERVDAGVDSGDDWVEDASHRVLLVDRSLEIRLLEQALRSIVRILINATHTKERRKEG